MLSGEVVQDMSDQFGKNYLQSNISSNTTDLNSHLVKYKIFVAYSLTFYVGALQIIMV